jgi:SAM-dependent methyltransferase
VASCTETPTETLAPFPSDDDTILGELVELAGAQGHLGVAQFGSLVSAHQYRGLYQLFRAHVPAGAEVLDWGAGNGHFSYFLLRAGYRVLGFSLHDEGFEAWRPAGPYRFVAGWPSDPVKLPLADRSLDAVASVGVLEHVRETGGEESASLREIARVLRPGGVFVCWHLPNRWSWIEAAARRISGQHHHVYRFTGEEIERLLAAAGLERVSLARYGFLPRNFWGRLRFLRGIGGRPVVARTWDALDRMLGRAVPFICQNFAVVARKPSAGTA